MLTPSPNVATTASQYFGILRFARLLHADLG